jgi:hypothetical protein
MVHYIQLYFEACIRVLRVGLRDNRELSRQVLASKVGREGSKGGNGSLVVSDLLPGVW